MSSFRKVRRPGFSLIELVVVVLIIALMLGLLVPAVERARSREVCTMTRNNLRQIGVAAHGAHDGFKKFPPFYGWYNGKLGSIHAHILPYIEGVTIFNQFPMGMTLQNASSLGAFPPFMSPLDLSAPDGTFPGTNVGITNYICNVNAFWFTGTMCNPPFPGDAALGYAVGVQRMPGSYLNGTSNSVFFATAVGDASATADGRGAGNVKGNHNYSNGYAHFPNLSVVNALPDVSVPAPGGKTPTGWARPVWDSYLPPVALNGNDTAIWRQPTQLTGRGAQVCMGDASTRTVTPEIA